MSAGQGHMIGTQGGRVPLCGHWGGCEWPCVQTLAWPQLLRGQVSLGDSRAARLRTLSEVTNYMSVERWFSASCGWFFPGRLVWHSQCRPPLVFGLLHSLWGRTVAAASSDLSMASLVFPSMFFNWSLRLPVVT